MQYTVDPNIPIECFKLGDTIVDRDNKPVDVIVINSGYMFPPNKPANDFFELRKENPLMSEKVKIYLTKEEIFALYEYAKSKEGK